MNANVVRWCSRSVPPHVIHKCTISCAMLRTSVPYGFHVLDKGAWDSILDLNTCDYLKASRILPVFTFSSLLNLIAISFFHSPSVVNDRARSKIGCRKFFFCLSRIGSMTVWTTFPKTLLVREPNWWGTCVHREDRHDWHSPSEMVKCAIEVWVMIENRDLESSSILVAGSLCTSSAWDSLAS